MRDVFGGIRTVVLAAVTLAAVALPVAADGAAPKWLWTPVQAQQQLLAAATQLQLPSGDELWFLREPTAVSGCRGVGKASQGRFGSFRCQARMVAINKNVAPVTKTVWFKVRRHGAGQVCASLTGFVSIPAGCLKTTGTRSSTVFKWDATLALNDWLRNWRDAQPNLPESQVVRHATVYGYGAGYFEVAWQLVEFSTQAVPLQSHHGVMVFGGNWIRPSGPHCVGSSCAPGLAITQTS